LARSRDAAQRPNFRQRRIVAFTAGWRYAKITPVALHCGDFGDRRREGAEALGTKPEFEFSALRHLIAGARQDVCSHPRWHGL
jgi:hypothetical protein